MQSQRPSYRAIPSSSWLEFQIFQRGRWTTLTSPTRSERWRMASLFPRENLEFRSMNENNRGTNSKWKFYYRPRNFEGHFKTTGKLVSPWERAAWPLIMQYRNKGSATINWSKLGENRRNRMNRGEELDIEEKMKKK